MEKGYDIRGTKWSESELTVKKRGKIALLQC